MTKSWGDKIIICITGQSCSGKTTLCNYIENRGYSQIIHASTIVKERYRRKETELSLLEFAEKELNTLGSQTFANDFLKYAIKETFYSIPLFLFKLDLWSK